MESGASNPDWDEARRYLDMVRPVIEYFQHQHRLSGIDILGWGVISESPPVVYVKTPPGFAVPGYINGIMVLQEIVD